MTSSAEVVQVAHLSHQRGDGGANPTPRLHFTSGTVRLVNPLLATSHYLGPVRSARHVLVGFVAGVLVACQVYRHPTARMLRADDTMLELTRWCLTPEAGPNAGSRMMGYARRWLREVAPEVQTIVSYSDPVHGHLGTLYRASGWKDWPTHHTLRYRANGVGYPSGHGSWNGRTKSTPKERWLMEL